MSALAMDEETAAQLISFELASFGNLPFQVLSPAPMPGKVGIRLHPDESYCMVDAVKFLGWLKRTRPSIDELYRALALKRRQK